MSDYLNMKIGSRGRLAILKRNADRLNALSHNRRKGMGNPDPYTWRDVRYCGFHNARAARCELSPGKHGDQIIYYCHTGQYFPRETWCDEIINLNHTGWFTDIDCRETVRGLVVSLPHGRYLAGYCWSENGERVYFTEIYDCQDTAAHVADSYAEQFGTDSQMDDLKYQKAQEIYSEMENAKNRLIECLALRNNPCFSALRDEARDLIKEIRDNRETLENEYADYAI